jgi:O-antigen ligase
VALGVLLAVRLRIKFVTIFIISSIAGLLLFQNFTKIFFRLEQNKTASSADIAQHIESMSNITSDYSNVERFNRWDCAIRMFKKRPFFGWGPGTYMFQYAPFQISYEKTPISTNMGDKGNAHSEYLGPLAESGFFGTMTFLLIMIFIIYTGLKVHKRMDSRSDKILLLSVLLGLITYFTHGLLNNFLDTDKASALFWAYIALIVVMDIKNSYNNREKLPAGEGKP